MKQQCSIWKRHTDSTTAFLRYSDRNQTYLEGFLRPPKNSSTSVQIFDGNPTCSIFQSSIDPTHTCSGSEVMLLIYLIHTGKTSRTESRILIKCNWNLNMDFRIVIFFRLIGRYQSLFRIVLIFTVWSLHFRRISTTTSRMGSEKREGAFQTGS